MESCVASPRTGRPWASPSPVPFGNEERRGHWPDCQRILSRRPPWPGRGISDTAGKRSGTDALVRVPPVCHSVVLPPPWSQYMKRPAKKHTFKPTMETLETRWCPATSIGLPQDGLLTITGDDTNNYVQVI